MVGLVLTLILAIVAFKAFRSKKKANKTKKCTVDDFADVTVILQEEGFRMSGKAPSTPGATIVYVLAQGEPLDYCSCTSHDMGTRTYMVQVNRLTGEPNSIQPVGRLDEGVVG